MSAGVDETPAHAESAETYVQRITLAKGMTVQQLAPTRAILAADTCVVVNGNILGKPEDEAHALHMLLQLSATTHEVHTGVALLYNGKQDYRLSSSKVRFCPISEAQARRYWATGEPADKAGAYAVQGRGALFVEHISGSYSGIMGLPLFETGQLLAKAGLLTV